jgi:hypothetical protein
MGKGYFAGPGNWAAPDKCCFCYCVVGRSEGPPAIHDVFAVHVARCAVDARHFKFFVVIHFRQYVRHAFCHHCFAAAGAAYHQYAVIAGCGYHQPPFDSFVAFYSGYIEKVPYGEKGYFTDHPQLTYALIDALLQKGVSIIGLDFAGIRRGKEHTPTDQACAEKGTFIIENLCNLKSVLDKSKAFTAHTYPLSYIGITGLPCRVIAEI